MITEKVAGRVKSSMFMSLKKVMIQPDFAALWPSGKMRVPSN
jgi:hypothetical protein